MCLDRMEHEGPSALQALCDEHPAHADKLRARIAQLGAFGLAGEQPADDVPERLGQFRLLARLGGGGMGVVYAAEQDGLQRRVALKLVRPGTMYFPGARERFRREVDVLARLQHPGIVPIYAGGEENGVPYLAMELVRGATLEEALAELSAGSGAREPAREPARLAGRDLLAAVHAVVARRAAAAAGTAGATRTAASGPPRSASSVASPLPGMRDTSGATPAVPALFAGNWVSTCVRLAQHVAEALAHAHEQGVLHRDIKPSNVMLTPEGRVLLLDFGLASAEGSVRLTGSGQPLGSPAYMSPEQVRGERDAADGRADVWSLGVTLYEALTLHQPFVTDSIAHTSRLVLAANPPAPRTRNPAIPPDLETVVLAAMERDAARRYAGPAEFALDLHNVLELRPITVRPPTTARRLLRWTQRRPALATACVLGGLLLVAGPLGWELKRRESMDVLLAARDQSERNFQAALSAIGHVLRDVATEELEDVPRMQRARLVAIDRALELFPQLERDRPDDEAVLAERAELHESRGDILRDLGRAVDALPEFDAAVALRRRLAERHADPEHAVRLSGSIDRAAKVRFAIGRPAEALPFHEEGIALLREACAQRPETRAWARALALALANLGETLRELDRVDESRAALDEALGHAVAVRLAQPGDAEAAWTEGRVCNDLATLLVNADQYAAAEPWARRSLEAYAAARVAAPERRFYAFDVTTGHLLLTMSLLGLARHEEGEAQARTGMALLDELLRDYPDAVRYREQRSRLLEQLGLSAGRTGRADEAVAILKARLAELDEACRLAPERADLAYEDCQALSNLAVALLDAHGDPDEILALLERGEQRLAALVAGASAPPWAGLLFTVLRYNRARALCNASRLPEARTALQDFERDAAGDAMALRYGADLWNEFRLALRRAGTADGEAEDAARERMYVTLAAALDAGYADVAELTSTPSLDAFREEPEFKELLARLAPTP